jgi:hypothetical protein
VVSIPTCAILAKRELPDRTHPGPRHRLGQLGHCLPQRRPNSDHTERWYEHDVVVVVNLDVSRLSVAKTDARLLSARNSCRLTGIKSPNFITIRGTVTSTKDIQVPADKRSSMRTKRWHMFTESLDCTPQHRLRIEPGHPSPTMPTVHATKEPYPIFHKCTSMGSKRLCRWRPMIRNRREIHGCSWRPGVKARR